MATLRELLYFEASAAREVADLETLSRALRSEIPFALEFSELRDEDQAVGAPVI
jgi:hypothetical protein